jgi:tetratricopeptide (TPR) repeat protein
MGVERLVEQAVERLNGGDVAGAKTLLRKAATLAPLRTDIRDLLQQCMEMQPSAPRMKIPARTEIPRQASLQVVHRRRSHFWLWVGLGAFLLLLLLIGGGAVALYYYWPLVPSLVSRVPGAKVQEEGRPTPAPTPTPSAGSEDLERARERAASLAGQGSYQDAIKTLESVLEREPQGREACGKDLARWHFELGKEDSRASRHSAAIGHLSRSAELDGTSAEYRFWLGLTYFRKGRTGTGSQKTRDLNAAREALSKAVDLDPGNLDALEQLAKTHIALGNKVEAGDCYNDIINRAPDSIQARTAREDLRNMGMRYNEHGIPR